MLWSKQIYTLDSVIEGESIIHIKIKMLAKLVSIYFKLI